MNSIHRVGVTIAGLATVATVAGAFVLQGYTAAQAAAQQAASQATASLAPEIVYVRPVPTPQTQPQPAVQPPPIIQIVPGSGDDDGSDRG